jgi:AraC-like DNA-binding protein
MTVRTNDEQTFLNRLTEITENNLTNDQFGVNKLAQEMGMSRSYIHRRLKSITNLSISQFICSLRLNKAMEMLEQNEVSAAEIAYEVGFSSPAYFNHCFHEHYGFPPGEFKKKLISDDKEENDVAGDNTTNTKLLKSEFKESSVTVKKLRRKKLFLLSAIVFVVLSLVGLGYIYFISSNRLSGVFHKDQELSIAVLPLKNLSSDPNTQWLADGIMEDIVTRLSHIKEFTVKSRNSAEIYRNSSKSTRKIASELGVTYLVEGSILK